MTEQHIELLRRTVAQAQASNSDIGLGANVLAALLDEHDRLRADVIGPAASRALNRTATSVRAEAVRAMRRTLPLSAKSLRSRLKIEASNQRTLTATIMTAT